MSVVYRVRYRRKLEKTQNKRKSFRYSHSEGTGVIERAKGGAACGRREVAKRGSEITGEWEGPLWEELRL